jgi:GH15 family glucan-1,4-alpha-glucosidase
LPAIRRPHGPFPNAMRWLRHTPYKPISAYGVIGDMRTAALVGLDGSIDWCCLPRFDSPSIFAALLDHDHGGRFRIGPSDPAYTAEQRYLPLTNILVTAFHNREGGAVLQITDHMPPAENGPEIAARQEIHRKVRCVRGSMEVEIVFEPRFDYARSHTELILRPHGILAGNELEEIALSAPLEVDWTVDRRAVRAVGRIHLHAGEQAWFILRYDAPDVDPVESFDPDETLERTAAFWHRWAGRIRYEGPYRAEVERSALALKSLFYAPTGAVVAAATTSLPEEIGGERNWDYRYNWLRDAAFTLSAFHLLGQYDEAEKFMRYLQWVAGKSKDQLRVLYGVAGEIDVPETELDHLEGYQGSKPVRIGNGAACQVQLDVYGELLDAAFFWHREHLVSDELWKLLAEWADWVAENWGLPDQSIWEVRGPPCHYVFSKVMCWVALDRAVRMAEELGRPGDVERWRREREKIHAEVMERGWSEEKQSFVQHYGTDALDAANLRIPLVGFLPGDHPRVEGTIRATLRELTRDGMLLRYTNDDGLAGGEGVFGICSFWLADALILAGEREHGERVFRRMLRMSNHLGLYSEELDPGTGDLLGNFPQAFSHIALINTAFILEQSYARERTGRPALVPQG